MKRRILFLFLVGLPLLTSALEEKTKVLSVSFIEAPPLTTSVLTPGKGYGFVSDVIQAAAKVSGLKFTPYFYPLKRTFVALSAGEVAFTFGNPDILAVNMGLPSSRFAYVPCAIIRSSFFYCSSKNPRGFRFNAISDLRGLRVGVPLGYYLSPSYKEAGAICIEYKQVGSAYKMLAAGRLDLVEEMDLVGYSELSQLFGDAHEDFKTLQKPSAQFTGGIAYMADDVTATQIAADFATGMRKIMKDGTYQRIASIYFGPGNTPQYLLDFINTYQ